MTGGGLENPQTDGNSYVYESFEATWASAPQLPEVCFADYSDCGPCHVPQRTEEGGGVMRKKMPGASWDCDPGFCCVLAACHLRSLPFMVITGFKQKIETIMYGAFHMPASSS